MISYENQLQFRFCQDFSLIFSSISSGALRERVGGRGHGGAARAPERPSEGTDLKPFRRPFDESPEISSQIESNVTF